MNVNRLNLNSNFYNMDSNEGLSKEVAINFLQDLYVQLPQNKFLVYGSLAKEFTYKAGKSSFGDIDLLVSHQVHELAVEELESALKAAGIKYEKDESEFSIYYKSYAPFSMQIVDRDRSKKAYPGGYMMRGQSQFNSEQIEYHNDLPCVSKDFLGTSKTSYFYHIDSPKHNGKQDNDIKDVSPFNF